MSEGVFRNISGSYYALGFYDDGTAVMGKPNLRINAETDRGSSVRHHGHELCPPDVVRYLSCMTTSFNARGTIGTSEPGLDVICSVDRRRAGHRRGADTQWSKTLSKAAWTPPSARGSMCCRSNLKSSESYLASMRALQVGDRITVSVSASSSEWNGVTNMIGALYQLVENGQVCAGLVNGSGAAHGCGPQARRLARALHDRRPPERLFHRRDADAGRPAHGRARLRDGAEPGRRRLDRARRDAAPTARRRLLSNKPSGGSERAVTNHIFLSGGQPPDELRGPCVS